MSRMERMALRDWRVPDQVTSGSWLLCAVPSYYPVVVYEPNSRSTLGGRCHIATAIRRNRKRSPTRNRTGPWLSQRTSRFQNEGMSSVTWAALDALESQ